MGENPYRTTELTLKLDKETLEKVKDFDEGGASMGIIMDYVGKDAVFAATEGVDFFGQKAIVMVQQEEENPGISYRSQGVYTFIVSFSYNCCNYLLSCRWSNIISNRRSFINDLNHQCEMAATIDRQERTIAQQSAA